MTATVIPASRLIRLRLRKQARDEQAIIEACERELENKPRDMGDLVERVKARVERERKP